ncbi:hypothetical protein AG1IA_05070 [Rhizoctonia solani AG-1 IA]|uniref:Uncharacterized protein n=1 Tax=Thanatephorus cucumeris (strain AG1-IA) TaxID=983506 RepID=L8WSE8_THACA|nr:hypothetical protein AG1IA_05070 [Rhizoctonia solani AG-1 IA]
MRTTQRSNHLVIDTVNTPAVPPSNALVASPDPDISLVELYHLSDHEDQACSASLLVVWFVRFRGSARSLDVAGRMAINYRQHHMSLSTFQAKMALGSWYGTPDIDEVEHIFHDWEGSELELVAAGDRVSLLDRPQKVTRAKPNATRFLPWLAVTASNLNLCLVIVCCVCERSRVFQRPVENGKNYTGP